LLFWLFTSAFASTSARTIVGSFLIAAHINAVQSLLCTAGLPKGRTPKGVPSHGVHTTPNPVQGVTGVPGGQSRMGFRLKTPEWPT
jgi:hypothetical protein